jgi:hypothetical protein
VCVKLYICKRFIRAIDFIQLNREISLYGRYVTNAMRFEVQGWRWRQYAPLKHWHWPASPHDVTTQKTNLNCCIIIGPTFIFNNLSHSCILKYIYFVPKLRQLKRRTMHSCSTLVCNTHNEFNLHTVTSHIKITLTSLYSQLKFINYDGVYACRLPSRSPPDHF